MATEAKPVVQRSPMTLIPWLQAAALVCFSMTGLQFLNEDLLTNPEAPLVTGDAVIAVVIVAAAWAGVAALWAARAYQGSRRVRLVMSAAAYLCIATGSQLGQVGFSTPIMILGVALLVLDGSWRIGMLACMLQTLASSLVGIALIRASVGWTLFNTLPVGIIAGVGLILGVLLDRFHMALVQQKGAIEERDAALKELTRKAIVDKELVLAKERARAASELHDGLGHRLTLIGMSLEYAQRVKDRDPRSAWEEIGGAMRAASEAMNDMRTWVRALSPVRSTHARGPDALDEIAASFRDTGLDVTVNHDVDGVIFSEEVELLMYRVVQEGLTNALRHGSAKSVAISLAKTRGEGFALVVSNPAETDAGSQFGGEELSPGVGLSGLRARAKELGGELSAGFVSVDPPEFVLRVTFPASAPAEAAL